MKRVILISMSVVSLLSGGGTLAANAANTDTINTDSFQPFYSIPIRREKEGGYQPPPDIGGPDRSQGSGTRDVVK